MKINEITTPATTVAKIRPVSQEVKARMAKTAAAISSPGTGATIGVRQNDTRTKDFDAKTSHNTSSKYISKSGDKGGTSLSKVSNITKSAAGNTGTRTKRYVRPGGSGTNTVTDVGTGKTTRTNFQLKGPQTWMYDK